MSRPDGPLGSLPARHEPERSSGLTLVALRVVQFVGDLAVLTGLCLVPLSVMLVLPRNPDGTVGQLLISIPVVLLALGACVALSWWCLAGRPARHDGRTFMMGLLGLRIIATDGGRASPGALSLRWLLLAVDGMFFGAVGLLAMLLTPRRQRVGDLTAATIVVRHPSPRPRKAAGPGNPGTTG